jgi:trk system potassium uptake protein TrkH
MKITTTSITLIKNNIDKLLLYLSFLGVCGVLFRIGYNNNYSIDRVFDEVFNYLFYLFALILSARICIAIINRKKIKILLYSEIFLWFYHVFIIVERIIFKDFTNLALTQPQWIYVGIFGVFVIELSKSTLFFDKFYFNPTLLFVLSFAILILIGTVLLLLPNSTTYNSLSFVDALFMASSAVCVTGLAVLDIGTKFTDFGQIVILVLVQLGGLGMMTFTGFFGYFFSGSFSYKNQLMFREFINEKNVGSVISTLYKIVFITILFEIIGATFIYFTLDSGLFNSVGHQIYFAIFLSISSFCNAGFTLLPQGLYEEAYRFNYNLHFIIAVLIIVGGLGFIIVFNIYDYFKHKTQYLKNKLLRNKIIKHRANVLSVNSKIILVTTAVLLIFGTVMFFILEFNSTLLEHKTFGGKIMTSFFGSVTPRTAGFNTVNMEFLSAPTLMVILFLMWIGASPGSTGGGIKTTTFAIASLNIIGLAKGKDRIELFGREISKQSTRRAFAIISLSFLVLGLSTFFLSITEKEQDLLNLAIESFSAFSTVGLSRGITHQISDAGKIVLIITMFVGRVGTLTFLIAIVKDIRLKNYRYPEEDINF